MATDTEIRTVAVVGAGLVGSGWTVAFALAGLNVRVFDADPAQRGRCLDFAATAMRDMAAVGLAGGPGTEAGQETEAALARIRLCDDPGAALDGADYVQESVYEDVAVKTGAAQDLGAAIRPGVIVGSSSSGIPASAFTETAPNRSRFLVVHPVNPPHLMPVVELVPAPWTDPDALAGAQRLMERIGKVPVVVRREIEGFIINRLQGALLNEAFALLEDGIATAAEIDATVSQGLGLRWSFMGPFETIDLNAPGGVADYARRLAPLYLSIAQSRATPRAWSPEVIAEAHADRRRALPAAGMPARCDWRDRELMHLVSHMARRRMAAEG